jgi:hypothetical protein
MYNKNKTNTMNKEFLKMQKIAGLITENQYERDEDEYPSLDQETYMDFLNACFECFDNGANAYDDSTWTDDERDLAQNLANVIGRAGIDIS